MFVNVYLESGKKVKITLNPITPTDPLAFDENTDGLNDEARWQYLKKQMSFYKGILISESADYWDVLFSSTENAVVNEITETELNIVRIKHSHPGKECAVSDVARALNNTVQQARLKEGLKALNIVFKPEEIIFTPSEIHI